MPKSWCPLESNPEVISKFAHKLGLDESLAYCDIFSTEDWALESVPRPVYAILLLFPVKDESEQFLEEEKKQIETNGQILSENVYFTKQIVGNHNYRYHCHNNYYHHDYYQAMHVVL